MHFLPSQVAGIAAPPISSQSQGVGAGEVDATDFGGEDRAGRLNLVKTWCSTRPCYHCDVPPMLSESVVLTGTTFWPVGNSETWAD